MKMAIGVEQRDEDGFVNGDELQRKVIELMESEKGREMRERCRMMSEMALSVRRECGSSTRALAQLAQVHNK